MKRWVKRGDDGRTRQQPAEHIGITERARDFIFNILRE
jgi:hypothetical protein